MSAPGTDPRETPDTISARQMHEVLQVDINNTQAELRNQQELIMRLESRLTALRDAQMHASRLASVTR